MSYNAHLTNSLALAARFSVSPVPADEPLEGALDFSPTDAGNAKRFVRQHGDYLRYSFGLGSWLVFDGQRWKRDGQRLVMELAKATALEICKDALGCKDDAGRRLLMGHGLASESASRLRAMVDLAKTDLRVIVEAKDLDAHPMLLNVANGTLDLSSGDLRQARPSDLLTKSTPIAFDPQAECPRWREFVREITDGDESLQRYLAQIAGYCLTGSTKEQAFFLMLGGGSNGKSVFLNVLRKLLGEYASTTDFNTFSQRRNGTIRDDLAKLKGHRLALCSEIEAGERLAEGVVKQVTGGDEISVRELYGKLFEYQPQYKILLATNHLPAIVGTGNGIWRRVQVVPFDVTFGEERQDPDLTDKLLAELPGILNWALAGCLSWQRRGRLDVPDRVWGANRDCREEMDSVHAFVNGECARQAGARIGASALYDGYALWCHHSGREPVSKKLFGTRLTEAGFAPHKNGQGNIDRMGLRLRTTAEKEAPRYNEPSIAAQAVPAETSTATEQYDPFEGEF